MVTRELRRFIYTDLCDTYVEFVKPNLADPSHPEFLPSLLILHSCVLTSLKLLHPLMPFITEELYQRLPSLPKEKRKESLMIDSYPVATDWNSFHNESLAQVMETALHIVTGVRDIKARYNLGKDVTPDITVTTDLPGVEECEQIIQRLGHCGTIIVSDETMDTGSLPVGYSQYIGDSLRVVMEVGSHMDVTKEIEKIDRQLAKIAKERLKIDKTLKGKFQFRKSPEEVASKHAQLDQVVTKLNEQKANLLKLQQ